MTTNKILKMLEALGKADADYAICADGNIVPLHNDTLFVPKEYLVFCEYCGLEASEMEQWEFFETNWNNGTRDAEKLMALYEAYPLHTGTIKINTAYRTAKEDYEDGNY